MPAAAKRKRGFDEGRGLGRKKKSVREAVEPVKSESVPGFEDEEESHDDDESEAGDEDNEAGRQQQPLDSQESPEKSASSSSKLPTAGELRAITQSRELYKDNAFSLKLPGLLDHVRPKVAHIPPLERMLQALHAHLTSMPEVEPVHPLEAGESLARAFQSGSAKAHGNGSTDKKLRPRRVAIPYPHPLPPRDAAWTVSFIAPPRNGMTVVGTWPGSLAVRRPDGGSVGVDVGVEMPKEMFQENDFKNSRLFFKRAFWVACVAKSLEFSETGEWGVVGYETAGGDMRRVCIILKSKEDGSEKDFSKLRAYIRVIPLLPRDVPIPPGRLSPSHANIKLSPLPSSPIATPATPVSAPSPLYNNTLSLTHAAPALSHLVRTHHLVKEAPGAKDALALLRVWANQRGFVAGSTILGKKGKGKEKAEVGRIARWCVKGFEGLGPWWVCVLEVLINGQEYEKGRGGGRVGKGLSSYQLFRAALDFFAKHNWEEEGVYMKVSQGGQKWAPEEWKKHYEAVFIDASGTVNMLAGVPVGSLHLLSHEAKTTLRLLDSNLNSDPFTEVFLTDIREPHARFDTVIRISLGAAVRRRDTASSLDFSSLYAYALHNVLETLRRALSSRAKVIVPLAPLPPLLPLDAPQPPVPESVTIGIILDVVHAFKVVTLGPAVGSEGVEEFKEFWGKKAELRRFKDGRILESVVWEGEDDSKERVPVKIVRYILEQRLSLGTGDVEVLGEDYGGIMQRKADQKGFGEALRAFEGFVRELKGLEEDGDLPLMVVAAKPCVAGLRYTAVDSPGASSSSSQRYLQPLDVVLQLERSTQWPDELKAIQKVKMSLLEGMASGLKRRVKGCEAFVMLDGEEERVGEEEGEAALEVVVDGFAFRVRIVHDREEVLLRETIEGRQEGRAARAERLLRIWRRRFVDAPAHHNAIMALCHRYPSFAGTVRLVKRWLGAHWMSSRVMEEAVELVCASVYLADGDGDGDMGVASSKRGFVRVMRMLSIWDGVVYVPLYEAVKGEAQGVKAGKGDAHQGHGEAQAMKAGKGRWRLMTEQDESGVVWVEDLPPLVAHRVKSVAQAAMEYLVDGAPSGFKTLFEHSTEDYDFVIHLDPLAVTRLVKSPTYANLVSTHDEESLKVGYNPAEMFFRDLRRIYGDIMELFYDVYGGTSIGGVWNPTVVGSERWYPWKVLLGFSSLPSTSNATQKRKTSVTCNVDGILAEVRRIGEGIVVNITNRSQK